MPTAQSSKQNIIRFLEEQPFVFWLDSSDYAYGDQKQKKQKSYLALSFKETREFLSTLDFFDFQKELQKSAQLFSEFFWFGFLGFELCKSFLLADFKLPQNTLIPYGQFFGADLVFIFDHAQKKTEVFNKNKTAKASSVIKFILQNQEAFYNSQINRTKPLEIQPKLRDDAYSEPPKNYLQSFVKIKEHLKAGDVYQINLTHRFEEKLNQSAVSFYWKLRQLSPVPFASFIKCKDYAVLSASPECLLKKQNDFLLSQPIKGTCARLEQHDQDLLAQQDLLKSAKNRAELLMITDLVRNDLGQIAKLGSVKTQKLFELLRLAQVHHLQSSVVARLHSNKNILDVLLALLPAGSISGAPKKRALEIITQLENFEREIYTGTIGFFHQEEARFNIPIRTMIHKNQKAYYYAGGGVVIDSDPQAEWQEIQQKAMALRLAFGLQ